VRELRTERVTLTSVFAEPRAIDALDPGAAVLCRIAPDEALLVGGAPAGGVADPHAVVLDVTDGWSVFALSGDTPRSAFAYVSAVPLPDEGFVQGDVAHVPVKVIVERDAIRFLVPSMWGEYLRDRILEDCPDTVEDAR